MIVYTPAPAATQMTTHLWSLSRPPQTRTEDDTQALFEIVTATNSSKWLMVDTELTIPVHPDAEMDGIADILQPYIQAGHLPADTNTQLAALIESKRGQPLTVYDAFPAFFKNASKTYDEMIAAGLITPPVP